MWVNQARRGLRRSMSLRAWSTVWCMGCGVFPSASSISSARPSSHVTEEAWRPLKADAKGLLAKIRCGVNDDVLAIAREKHRRAETVVARIFRSANAAMAAERRDAHRCA